MGFIDPNIYPNICTWIQETRYLKSIIDYFIVKNKFTIKLKDVPIKKETDTTESKTRMFWIKKRTKSTTALKKQNKLLFCTR